MKILVTGAAGYIGSVLVPQLLKTGYEVTAIDNFMYRQNSLLDCCNDENLSVIRGDVRDMSLMKGLLRGVDVVIPLACYTGAAICEKEPDSAKGITINALQDMISLMTSDQKIIYPNTNSGYGVGDEGIYCTEESVLRPVSLYGKLKNEAESIALDHENTVVFRLATVFGSSPKMRLDLLVNDFAYRAYNDRFIVVFEGDFKRNYIHIRDVVDAFMFAIDNFESMRGEAYNLGLDEANMSKLELCALIKKYMPDFYFTEAQIGKDPDRRNYIVSNEKLINAGFKAKRSIDDSVRELINAFNVMHGSEYKNA